MLESKNVVTKMFKQYHKNKCIQYGEYDMNTLTPRELEIYKALVSLQVAEDAYDGCANSNEKIKKLVAVTICLDNLNEILNKYMLL